MVEGGTLAWIEANLPVTRSAVKVISLERQVRIVAGSLVLIGVLLGWFVHPDFFGLSAFVGAGLVFAGITDFCGMGLLLAKLPWNTRPHARNPMTTPLLEQDGVAPASRRDAVWMAELVDESVTELLRSYQRVGGLNNRDAHNMPSKRAVGQICEDLLQILFPGFHDEDAVHHNSLEELTAARLSGVVKRLTDQVRKSVRIGDPHKPTGRTPPIIRKFCQALPEVRELLRTDIEAAFEGDPADACTARRSFSPTRSSKPSPFSGWRTGCIITARPWFRA